MPPGRRTPPPRPRGATGFQPPRRPSTAAPANSSYMNPAYQTQANQQNFKDYANAGGDLLGPGQASADLSMAELFMGMFGPNGVNGPGSNGPGGGGGSGGGSGKPGDPDPLGWNAIAQQQALEKGYAEMLAAQDAKNKALAGSYDSRTAALTGANQSSIDRFAGLQQQLQAQRAAAQQAAAGTFEAGQRDLEGLRSQYEAMIRGRQAPAAQTLQAFGADPGASVSDPSGVQNMLIAQQANLARVGQADNALYAGRDNVYAGLNQDVSTQRQQGFDALMAKLLAEKQATEAAGASERAQLAMQQQQAILQMQAQEQARRASYG